MFKHAPGLIVHDSSVNIIKKIVFIKLSPPLVDAQKQYEPIISHPAFMTVSNQITSCIISQWIFQNVLWCYFSID